MTPTTFGRYRLLQELGRGGMAEVFKAKSFGVEGFEKVLVIKRILPELAKQPSFVEMFVREAKLAVRLSHANIVQVFDLGRVEEAPSGDAGGEASYAYYMAMEYVQGVDLATFLARSRMAAKNRGERWEGLPPSIATHIVSEVAKGLEHAHRRKDESGRSLAIVHRDISPQNILLSFEGEVKVTDFGIAKALGTIDASTAEALQRGKASYMSPEQAKGEDVDARTDLFSLGVVLYECLTGVNPFEGATRDETLRRARTCEVTPIEVLRPDLPKALIAIVEQSLAKAIDARFPDAARLYEVLLTFLYDSGPRQGQRELASLLSQVRVEPTQPSLTPGILAIERGSGQETPVEPSLRRASTRPSSIPPTSVLDQKREIAVIWLDFGPREELVKELSHATLDAITVVEKYGGTRFPREGNGVLAAFGIKDPSGREVELATRAALILVRILRPLDPSIGIHVASVRVSGPEQTQPDETLRNLFFRSREFAKLQKGRVALSREAQTSVREVFEFEPFEHSSTGRGAYVIGTRTPKEAEGIFIGRKAELSAIGHVLARATQRSAQVLTLRGDHGIGKTKLLSEVERRLERGKYAVGFYRGECPPQGRELPLSAIVCMLHSLCGTVEGETPEQVLAVQPRLRALGLHSEDVNAILGALGARNIPQIASVRVALKNAFARMVQRLCDDKPYMLVWDSAHWLDDESAAVLLGVIGRLSETRVVFGFSGRPGFTHGLEAFPSHTVIELGDLSTEEAQRFVDKRLGIRAPSPDLYRFVLERAGGHPLFLGEIVRAVVDARGVEVENGVVKTLKLRGLELSLPRTLRGLVAARIAKLSADARRVLGLAAVLGQRSEISMLSEMCAVSLPFVEDQVSLLERAEFFSRPTSSEVEFRSPVVREIVLESFTPDVLKEFHRAAMMALDKNAEEANAERSHRLAEHAYFAGETLKASEAFAHAAKKNVEQARHEQAASELARAFELAPAFTPERALSLVSLLRVAVGPVRICPDATSILEKVTASVDQGGTPRERVLARVEGGLLLCSLHRFESARTLLHDAERLAEGDEDLAKHVLFAYADLAARQGDFNRAIAMLERLTQLLRDRGDPLDEIRTLVKQAQAFAGLGERRAALAAVSRIERLAPDDGETAFERARVRTLVEFYSGDFEAAEKEAREALLIAERSERAYDKAWTLQHLGEIHVRQEDYPRAYGVLTRSVELSESHGFERHANHSRMFLAFLDGLTGDNQAERLLRQGIAFASAEDFTEDTLNGHWLLASLFARRGYDALAIDELEKAFSIAHETGNRRAVDDCNQLLAKIRKTVEQ